MSGKEGGGGGDGGAPFRDLGCEILYYAGAVVVLGILSEMGKERLQRGILWVRTGSGIYHSNSHCLGQTLRTALSRFNKGLKVQLRAVQLLHNGNSTV